jgi:hypothetical protein
MLGIDLQRQVALTPAPVPMHLIIEGFSNNINTSYNTNNTTNNINKPNIILP